MQPLPAPLFGVHLAVALGLALAACTDGGDSAPASSMAASTSSGIAASTASATGAAMEPRCVDETVDQSREDAVVGADLAAWLIEDQLPPPLRTSGLQSGETTIRLDGEPVGEVDTEEVDDGIFRVTGYSFCVPGDVDLARIDVEATLGGDWRLVGATPDLGLPDAAEVGLTIAPDTVAGRAVCNEYDGFVAAGPDGTWRISRLLATEAFCGEAESNYFDALGATRSWSVDGPELVLEGPGVTLRHAPVAP